MNLYIIRHGEDIDNSKNLFNGQRNQPITDNGKIQAEKIANYFKENKIIFKALFSSPLERAFHTAQIISPAINLKPIINNRLIERNIGKFSGLSVKEALEIYDGEIFYVVDKSYFINPPEGESFESVEQRLLPFLKILEQEYTEDENICIVTHGMVVKILYSIIYNLDYQKAIATLPVKNGDLFLMNKNKPIEFLIKN